MLWYFFHQKELKVVNSHYRITVIQYPVPCINGWNQKGYKSYYIKKQEDLFHCHSQYVLGYKPKPATTHGTKHRPSMSTQNILYQIKHQKKIWLYYLNMKLQNSNISTKSQINKAKRALPCCPVFILRNKQKCMQRISWRKANSLKQLSN